MFSIKNELQFLKGKFNIKGKQILRSVIFKISFEIFFLKKKSMDYMFMNP